MFCDERNAIFCPDYYRVGGCAVMPEDNDLLGLDGRVVIVAGAGGGGIGTTVAEWWLAPAPR